MSETAQTPPAKETNSGGAAPTPPRMDVPLTRRTGVARYATALFFKFNNDCTTSLMSMLAFSMLTSFVSLILAMVLILALLPGAANSVHGFAGEIDRILPAGVRNDANIPGLISSIHSARGVLTLITSLGLLWGGTNLFGSIETAFAFIYRVKTRDLIPQKLMSLILIVLFAILLPSSFVSSLLLGAAVTTLGGIMPGPLTGPFSTALGLAAGLLSLLLLFLAIYIIVPNMPIAWRHAWRGAAVAALIMWVVNTAFPFYAAHFIGTHEYGAATIGTVIITITWVWFFSLVLLLGAQINALGLGIAPWKYDLTRILMEYDGPVYPLTHQRGPRGRHAPLPFSGLVHDSYKVRRAERADQMPAEHASAPKSSSLAAGKKDTINTEAPKAPPC